MGEEEQTDDLEAMIAKAFDEGDETPVETPAQPVEAAAPETPETEKPAQSGERVRDEHGRFAKADEAGQNPQVGEEPAQQTILPPRSWTAAAKAKFATLDPDVQQEVLRREKEIDAGKQQWDTKAAEYNQLDAALSRVRDRYRLAGLTDAQYVGALVQADEMLRGPQAVQALAMLAQQYGINLGQLGPQQFGGPQPYADPQITALQQTIQSLQSRVEEQDKAREMEAQAALQKQIEDFASDPRHPYFDNVRVAMGALMRTYPNLSMEEAYERACYADPEIRGLLSAVSSAKPAVPQTKPGGLSVTGASKGTKPALSNGALNGNSIEDDVRAAIQELTGAV